MTKLPTAVRLSLLLLLITMVFIYMANHNTDLKISKQPDLVIPILFSKVTLDPHIMEDGYSFFLSRQVHRSLFRYTSNGNLVADLVLSYDESSDGKRITFRLKPETFTNGQPITSDKVVNSLLRAFYKKASITEDLSYIEGYHQYFEHGDIEALAINTIDDLTFSIGLKRRSALIYQHLATPDLSILNVNSHSDAYDVESVSGYGGPYEPRNFSDNGFTLHMANKDHDEKAPRVVDIRYYEHNALAKAALNAEVDTIAFLEVESSIDKKLQNSGWRKFYGGNFMERFIVANPEKIPLPVRAILRRSIHEIRPSLKDLGLTPAYGLIPPGLPGAIQNEPDLPAVEKLSHPTTFALEYHDRENVNKKIADRIAKAAEKYNLEIIPKQVTSEKYFENVFTNKSDLVMIAKGLDYLDGYSILTYFYNYPGKQNLFYFQDSSINSILERVPEISNISERAEVYVNIQNKILAANNCFPISFGWTTSWLWSPKVESIPPHPMGFHWIELAHILMAE